MNCLHGHPSHCGVTERLSVVTCWATVGHSASSLLILSHAKWHQRRDKETVNPLPSYATASNRIAQGLSCAVQVSLYCDLRRSDLALFSRSSKHKEDAERVHSCQYKKQSSP
eukprot:2379259-Amphidinium_carterae.2